MRITCPACDAVYDVPETILARPRLMRCARCAHDFRPPTEAAPVAEWPEEAELSHDEPAPAGEAALDDGMPARPLPPRPRVISRAERAQILAAWAASLVAVVVFVWLGIAYRRPVMHAWPPSARLYAALGYGHAAPPVQKEP